MEKQKILFHLNQLGYGGTEKAILNFARYLDKSRYQIFLYYWDDRYSLKYFRLLILKIFFKSSRNRFEINYRQRFSREKEFLEVFEKQNCFHGNLSSLKKAFYKIDPDILHLNRGVEEDFYLDWISKLDSDCKVVESNIFGRSARAAYLSRLSSIFFVSHWLKDRAPWAREKAKTLYNPILKPQSEGNLRKELNIPDKAIVLGRAHRPDLDQDDFLQQVYETIMTQTDQDIFFLSLGSEPSYSSNFKMKVGERLKYIPPTIDEKRISQFYNTIDIFTHRRPEGETFGMILAEAMIHGKVVVSHLSAVDNAQCEIIDNNELISGFDDVNKYAEIVLSFIKDSEKRKIIGQNLRLRALDFFEARQSAKRLEEYYQQL